MIYYSLVARYEDRYNIDEMVSKCANKQKEYCKILVYKVQFVQKYAVTVDMKFAF